jgi:beta-xylosidase
MQTSSNAMSLLTRQVTRRAWGEQVLTIAAIGLVMLTGGGAARAATITVDASKQTAGNPHFWSSTFGTGKAMLSLRSDWQTHAKIGNRELGAQRVRGHGLFNSGEMDLYKGAGSYDWTKLDTYLSAITLANMRPLIETDFMPTALGSSSSDAMHSAPKDYTAWNNFIKAFTQHLVDKYGATEVGTWYFEIWNEPDYPGFWVTSTDMGTYYTLYDNTVGAITSVLPNALVGGPATTNAGPVSAFLAHCKSAGTRVTFASSHIYPGGANTGTSADAASFVSDNNSRISAITSNGYSTTNVKSFNTEWNSSYSGQGGNAGDAVMSMDNHWNVGFILKAAKLLSDKNSGSTPPLDVFSYWALTDVFDEDGGTDGIHMTSVNSGNTPFGQVFGLMTFQGMRKAAFNAFKLLNYLGPNRLSSSGGTGSDGIDAMATTSAAGDELQILVYNYYKTLNTASGTGDSVTVNVSNLPAALANKDVFVTQFLVDEGHSNPYKVWADAGKPGTPSEAQWQSMRKAQHLALSTSLGNKQAVTTSFSASKQAGTLIIVSAKRPLSGRNALVELEGEDYDGQSGSTTIKEDSGDSSTLGQSISLAGGGWVYFENVDYTDDGVASVQLRVKSGADTTLELHQDTQTGTLLGSCKVTSTSNAWAMQSCTLSQTVTGMSKLYVVAVGAIHLNWLKFVAGGSAPGTGGTGGGTGGSTGGGTGGSTGVGTGGATGSGTGGTTGGSGGTSGGTTGKGGSGGTGGTTASGSGGSSGSSGGSSGGAGGSSGGSGGSNGGSGGTTTNGGSGGGNGGSGGGNGSSGGGSGGSGGSSSGSGGSSGGSGGSTGGGKASGCSCRIGNPGESSGTLLIVGLLVGALGLRRQRARRCR